MTHSPPSNGLSTTSRRSSQEAWSPPPFLLETAAGDDDLIAELVVTFNIDTSARIRDMRAAFEALDFPKVRTEAHTIKGGARQVGADALADALQELEGVCKPPQALLAAVKLNRVQELFEEIRRAMALYGCSRRLDASLTP